MADAEVNIRARDLTKEAFEKVSAALKELDRGAQETGKKSRGLGDGIADFFSKNSAAFGIAASVIAAAGAAIAGLSAGVIALGARGADIADVKDQFNVLNTAIGNNADTMRTRLGAAMQGTISEFELMKSVNQALSQGLQLNADQMELTAKAARVLADRTGGDTAQAFGTLLTAMASGRDMMLKTIGANIDGKAATEAYAAAIGLEVGALTEAQQIEAKRQAILTELNRTLEVSGAAQFDFADAVAAGKVAFLDFVDGLSEGIARSPELAAGIDAVRDAIGAAFGGTQKALIDGIVKAIEFAVIAGLEVGRTFVTFGEIGVRVFGVLGTVVNGLLEAITGLIGGLAAGIAKLVEIAASVPGVGSALDGVAEAARGASDFVEGLRASFEGSRVASQMMATGQSELSAKLQAFDGILLNVRNRMVDAMAAQRESAVVQATAGRATRETTLSLKAQEAQAKAAAKGWDAFTSRVAASAATLDAQKDAIGRSFAVFREQLFFTFEGVPAEALPKFVADIGKTLPSVAPQLGAILRSGLQPSIVAGFGKIFREDVPQTILAAFTGGGNVFQALDAIFGGKLAANLGERFGATLTKGLSSVLGSTLGNTIGNALNMILPGLGGLIGGFIGKIGGWLKRAFGGPSEKELAGRESVRQFEDAIIGVLSATQQAEAAGQRWAQVVIGVRDAYIAAGRPAEEGVAAVQRLWDAIKQGPEATQLVIDEIERVRAKTTQTTTEAADGFQDLQDKTRDYVGELVVSGEQGEKFTTTLSGGFDRVVAELQKLIALMTQRFPDAIRTAMQTAAAETTVFTDAIGDALDAIPKEIDVKVNQFWNPRGRIEGPGGEVFEIPEAQRGLIGNFGRRGTPVLLHGAEAVVPLESTLGRDLLRAIGDRADAPALHLTVNVNGAMQATSFTRQLVEEVRANRRQLRTELLQALGMS